jgi:hypothetical protein
MTSAVVSTDFFSPSLDGSLASSTSEPKKHMPTAIHVIKNRIVRIPWYSSTHSQFIHSIMHRTFGIEAMPT